MKTAYAYARFSSENQREESIDAQVRAIKEYCDRESITLLRVFRDEGFSARTANRPGFQELFSLIKRCPADYLIVHKLDRFSRNRCDSALYKSKLKEKGMKLISVLEPIDETPESIIMEGLLESMSEYYSANLAREVRKGMHENTLNGKRNGGKPPRGYDAVNQHLVPNSDAHRVKTAYEMYAEGKPYKEIVAKVGWSEQSINKILQNEVYLGVLKHGIDRMENAHEPIISKDLWNDVRRRMDGVKQNAANRAKHNYVLSNLIICGQCGKKMVAVLSGDYQYYFCRTKGCKCWRKEELEQRVIDELAEHLKPTDEIKAKIWELAHGRVNNQEEIEKAKQAQYICSQRISALIEAVSYAKSSEEIKSLMGQVNEIRANMPKIPEPITEFTREETDAFCDEFFDLKKRTPEDQKVILRRATSAIVVYPDHLDLFTMLPNQLIIRINKTGLNLV